MNVLNMAFKMLKIKLPFSTDENVLKLIDTVEKYNIKVEDFDREAYVVMLSMTGSERSLKEFMKDYGFTKPLAYYML